MTSSTVAPCCHTGSASFSIEPALVAGESPTIHTSIVLPTETGRAHFARVKRSRIFRGMGIGLMIAGLSLLIFVIVQHEALHEQHVAFSNITDQRDSEPDRISPDRISVDNNNSLTNGDTVGKPPRSLVDTRNNPNRTLFQAYAYGKKWIRVKPQWRKAISTPKDSTVFSFEADELLRRNARDEHFTESGVQKKLVGDIPIAASIYVNKVRGETFIGLHYGCTLDVASPIDWPWRGNVSIAVIKHDNSVHEKWSRSIHRVRSCQNPKKWQGAVHAITSNVDDLHSAGAIESGRIRYRFKINN